LVDYLFVINRDLKILEKVYSERKYNENKVRDNLETESFNLCFYEAIENGFRESNQGDVTDNSKNDGQVFTIENKDSIDEVIETIKNKINK
jgi:broad-specificity NMP kinase